MRLALIHQRPGSEPPPGATAVWRTCLREIHFVAADAGPIADDAVTDADAYALLLEVVCGLRSPLIGETEVQAQFKQFLASTPARENRWLQKLGQQVLGDAKRVRCRHLQGFGAHSYGRLAARHFTGDRLAVVGTGALAAQVVASARAGTPVDVWGRSAERLSDWPSAPERFTLLADAGQLSGTRHGTITLVIAAPAWSYDIERVTDCYTDVELVVDLRSSDQQTPVVGATRVLTLAELLAEACSVDHGGASRVPAARVEIRDFAEAFEARSEPILLRPLGWDDVCA